MKIWIFFLLASFCANSSEFNGYIIKFKNNKSAGILKNRLGNDLKNLDLSYGSYSLWTPSSNKNSIYDLKNDPNIEYIEPNFLLKEIGTLGEAEVIVDEFFDKQWALYNTGENAPRNIFESPKKGIDINAKEAWKITKGSKDIIIGVLDSGVLYNHPDLVDNMWINEDEANGIVGVDDDGNGYIDDIHGFVHPDNKLLFPTDENGHGTHIAGIIGMAHNNFGGKGILEKVKIMPLKLKNDRTFAYDMATNMMAIDYAINKKVNIITTSIGGDDYSKAFEEAIQKAIDSGITFVCACGNSRINLDKKKVYPPSYVDKVKDLIVVCHHGPGGKKHYLSNRGAKTVTTFAPGEYIHSTYVSLFAGPDGFKTPEYKSLGGSSMAAPFVAGALGLLFSIEPNLTPKQAKERLVMTAQKEKGLSGHSNSNGRLELFRLLKNIRD